MKNLSRLLVLLLIAGLNQVMAQSAEDKGLAVAKEADARDTGFGDSVTKLTMTLTNQHGQTSSRFMSTRTLEVDGDGDKSLIVFDSPRDVKGTATLTYTHKSDPDDQWLFLPALQRVKRISSNNKSGPFMGSEFAYEDLSSQEVEKYSYKYLGEESLAGVKTIKIERYPVDPKSGYTKQIIWYNADNYRQEKAEFYDRKDAHLKTLTYSDYQVYLDKYWRAGEMLMVNHQTGKKTLLEFDDYQFATGLADNDFTQNSLKRAR